MLYAISKLYLFLLAVQHERGPRKPKTYRKQLRQDIQQNQILCENKKQTLSSTWSPLATSRTKITCTTSYDQTDTFHQIIDDASDTQIEKMSRSSLSLFTTKPKFLQRSSSSVQTFVPSPPPLAQIPNSIKCADEQEYITDENDIDKVVNKSDDYIHCYEKLDHEYYNYLYHHHYHHHHHHHHLYHHDYHHFHHLRQQPSPFKIATISSLTPQDCMTNSWHNNNCSANTNIRTLVYENNCYSVFSSNDKPTSIDRTIEESSSELSSTRCSSPIVELLITSQNCQVSIVWS